MYFRYIDVHDFVYDNLLYLIIRFKVKQWNSNLFLGSPVCKLWVGIWHMVDKNNSYTILKQSQSQWKGGKSGSKNYEHTLLPKDVYLGLFKRILHAIPLKDDP